MIKAVRVTAISPAARTLGRSSTAYSEAQALVWAAMEHHQRSGLEKLWRSEHLDGNASWVFVSRRWDETTMWLHLPAGVRSKWIEWTFRAMEADKSMTPESIAELVPILSRASAGLVHVLTQRAVVRASSGHRSLVVIPPLMLQRSSASNLTAALQSCSGLSWETLIEQVGTRTGFVLIHMSVDQFSANVRAIRELEEAASCNPAVAILPCYCSAHEVGTTSVDAPGVHDVISSLFQLAKLLQNAQYRDKFLVAMGLAIRTAPPIGLEIPLADRPGGPDVSAVVRLLLGVTVFRSHAISGCHGRPVIGWPPEPRDTELGRMALPIATAVSEVWHTDSRDFRRIRHFCDPISCGCVAAGTTAHRLISVFYDAVLFLLPPRAPELGRWTTTSSSVAFVTFVTLFGLVGPDAWLHTWSLEHADRLHLGNEAAGADVFVRENSKRLQGARALESTAGASIFQRPLDFAIARQCHGGRVPCE